jgi:hypothetical protein
MKLARFFWLDVPVRAVGAAYRAAFQPGKTCPLCVYLRMQGLTARGNVAGNGKRHTMQVLGVALVILLWFSLAEWE